MLLYFVRNVIYMPKGRIRLAYAIERKIVVSPQLRGATICVSICFLTRKVVVIVTHQTFQLELLSVMSLTISSCDDAAVGSRPLFVLDLDGLCGRCGC